MYVCVCMCMYVYIYIYIYIYICFSYSCAINHSTSLLHNLNAKNDLISLSAGEDGKGAEVVHIGKAVGNSDVWFCFNEGVSNAVRRNIYIRELL